MHIESIGAGPDIVLVHGWGWHGGIWDDIAGALASTHRVWVVDLPGHGRSRASEAFTLHDVVDAIAARAPAATWIGWSLGGLVALSAASRARAHRLVLVGTTPRFMQLDDWSYGMSPEWFERFSREIDSDAQRALERFTSLHLAGVGSERPLLRRLRAELARHALPETSALRTGLRLLQDADMRSSLAKISAPALVWQGTHDQIVNVEAGAYLSRQLPIARFERVENAGHASFLSHADALVNSVRNFLRE